MIHIPVLRHGVAYESVDKVTLVHHVTGAPVAQVSQANPGMVVRDVHRMDDSVLERFSVAELMGMCRGAAERFLRGTLPLGERSQTFEDYVAQLSATTGMPIAFCKSNAEKIHRVLHDMETIVIGLTRGFDLGVIDRGYGTESDEATKRRCDEGKAESGKQKTERHEGTEARRHGVERQQGIEATRQQGRTLSFFREGRVFGAVLPSNSPGVHGLWIPAIALKAPIVLKPGREEPWTPYRVIQALVAEGVPREAFGFYPTDHAGAGELLRSVDRGMIFGDTSTTNPWRSDPRIEIHGPGFSKVLLGDDAADAWKRHLDVIELSIAANGGRSCINASGVWTPKHGRAIAEELAARFARVQALPADDPQASIAAFANPQMAERMSAMIDHQLKIPGAIDLTEKLRGSPRLVTKGRVAYLLPTVIWCEDREHPLANREFLFPFASVVECPTSDMPAAIGSSLVVSAITDDPALRRALMNSPNVDRLNLGAIPTVKISWDQPHEGNLFELLYRQRAFQMEPAA